MTASLLLMAASLSLALAAVLNETGIRRGGIVFYRFGRWRLTACKARNNSERN